MQRKARHLLAQRDNGFSVWASLHQSWRRLALRGVVLLLAIVLYLTVAHEEGVLVLIGILAGATLQDLGWVWRIGKQWDFTESIIDWEKVRRLASSD